jgi:hypothetical protein
VVKGMDKKWDDETPSKYEIDFDNCVNRIEVLDGFSAKFYYASWPVVGED